MTTATAKSLQSCLTLCDPRDGSPPGSPVPGILQARTLEWVAISFCNAWKWKVKVKSLSRVQPSATPRTAAFQAPLSMGFPRQEYWSGVPLPSPSVHLTQCLIRRRFYFSNNNKSVFVKKNNEPSNRGGETWYAQGNGRRRWEGQKEVEKREEGWRLR